MASGPIISWQIEGEKVEAVTDFIFLGSKITVNGDCSHEIKRCLFLGRKTVTNLDSILKSRDVTLLTNVSQSYGLSSSHVRLWKRDHKEGWVPKKWWFRIVLLEKILESPLDSKENQPVHPKGNQSWIFTGRTDAEAEAPILLLVNVKTQLIGKDPDAGKDWKQEKKGVTEDEMFGWHHWLSGYEFEQTPADNEGQGSLMCCNSWGCKDQTWLSCWTTTVDVTKIVR